MARMGKAAMDWAKSRHSYIPSGMCQQFTRLAFGAPGGAGSAGQAWRNAEHKHYVEDGNRIPAGVPVYWTGGSRGYGHAAVSIGNGLVRSTDWPRRYSIGTARINDITRNWGLNLQGWTEDINGTRVWQAAHAEEPRPVLDVSLIVKAARNNAKCPHGRRLKRAVAAEVGQGGMQFNNSRLGSEFQARYRLVQIKFMGDAKVGPGDTNGIPGPASLAWLGARHGFTTEH